MNNTSPWSKIPVLSPEDQITYNYMRFLAELQERIDMMGEGYPEIPKKKPRKPKFSVEYVDNPDEMIDMLEALLEGRLK